MSWIVDVGFGFFISVVRIKGRRARTETDFLIFDLAGSPISEIWGTTIQKTPKCLVSTVKNLLVAPSAQRKFPIYSQFCFYWGFNATIWTYQAKSI